MPVSSAAPSADTHAPRLAAPRLRPVKLAVVGIGVAVLSVLVVFPLLSVFLYASGNGLVGFWASISSPEALFSLKFTVVLAGATTVVNGALGTFVAFMLVRHEFPLKGFLNSLIDLPVAIPAAVTGFTLLLLYGPMGMIGRLFEDSGITIMFAFPVLLLAHVFLTLPFVVRAVGPVLQEVDESQEEAAKTLGANEAQIFVNVILPAIKWGLTTRYPQKVCKQSGGVPFSLNNTGSRPKRGDRPPMRKESTESRSKSRPEWEQLEDWVRSQVQRLIQELLEEEVTAFLGRAKSALRSDSDNDTGYRNGYGRARRLTLSSGTIQLRRPRVRDTEEQFESRLLPLFVNRTRKVAELIPELYLHGLSEGDFDLALRGLLGEDAPVSASTVARLKSKWNDELAQWRSRPLDDLEVVYMWVDGVYVKAGLEKEKAAVLVVMAALSDGSKVVVSTVPGYRESTESWSEVLRDMRRRGLSCPRLVVGDGHLGIWGALRNVYPQAAEQRCWNHKIVNVLAKLPKRQQDQAKLMLRTIPYAPTRTEAERLRTVFTRWCGDHSYEAASEALERDWDRMVTFYDFPKEHWGHLRTTNPVESPFAALRLRTDAAKRYKRVDRAIAVIWKMLMVAEQRFRRLKAPELIEDVYLGAQYADGIAIESTAEKVAA